MTARKDFIGLVPSHTTASLEVVPDSAIEARAYLDKQFTTIFTLINSLIRGGAYTPQSSIPEKLKDGDIYHFPVAIAGTDITSGGLWQYSKTRYEDNLEIVYPIIGVWQNILPFSKPTIPR